MSNLIVNPDIEGYTRPWYEFNSLLREIIDMEDDSLIDEIIDICFTNHVDVDRIVSDYYKYGNELTEIERNILYTFYILAHGEEGFEE